MSGAAVEDRGHFEPVLVYAATPGRGIARAAILLLLAAAPLALGSVYPAAYVPLLCVAFAVGAYSLDRERRLRSAGVVVTDLPGQRVLIAFAALVLFQLVPLPPWLLSIVSPGSFAFYNDASLVPLRDFRPITASPADTARGLLFFVGMSLLYLSAYRELDHPAWRRRAAKTIVGVGFVMTIEALVQQAYAAHVIYGLWSPRWDWAVFGPYVNRNLFAGYMLMAVPLGVGLTAEALDDLRRAWRRRRKGWLALGDPEASAFFRWAAVSMVLAVGLLATRSRGAVLGLLVWALSVPFVSRRRLRAALAIVLVAGLGLAWVGFGTHVETFAARGVVDQVRVQIWSDSARLIPLHPLLGSGFNAFGSAFPPYQRVFPTEWIPTTHNDYLQILVDTGLVGSALALILLLGLLRGMFRSAAQGPFHAGIFGSLVAVLAHNLVDCNWQLAANAGTFVVLAGLAVQAPVSSATDARPRGTADDDRSHRRYLDPHEQRA